MNEEMIQKEYFNWIKKVVDSCMNEIHIEGCNVLIQYYEDRFKDADGILDLQIYLTHKKKDILNIIT